MAISPEKIILQRSLPVVKTELNAALYFPGL
jgi:hypothetical protein